MLEMRSIDVEAKSEHGRTCLRIAAENGHLSICRLLLDKRAQVDAIDSCGMTPLLWTALRGRVEIVRLLCDHGADVEAYDDGGCRPLHLAAMNGHIAVVKELVEERNAEINAETEGGRTALWWSRLGYKDDISAYLVSRGGIA